jgi:hypothetical protein
MPSKPPRGESRSSRTGVRARACVSALVCIGLGGALLGALPSSAIADGCPNAQFRFGPSEHLPDCRAYEQVSPVEKSGADALTVQPLFPAQSSPCAPGEACTVAYMNVAAAFDGAQGNELPNAYLATRGVYGWQTTALTPPAPPVATVGHAKVSYAFSGDLSQAILRVPPEALTEGAPAGVYNLFLRQPGGGYSLVTASAPAEPPQCGGCFEHQDVPAFAGASGDFSHVIFEANDSLTAGAPGKGADNLYESAADQVRLVGILPDGAIAPLGATAGGGIQPIGEQASGLEHAISRDGSDVLFQAAADGGPPDPQQAGMTELYDRIGGSATVEVSAPAPGAQPARCETAGGLCAAQPAQFWGASADGSVVFFTSKATLTRESNTGPEGGAQADPGDDLYRYDLDTGTLSDLVPDAADPNGADVLGVVGSSEDGSYVYFVADGKLAAGASSGQPNLYVWHEAADGAPNVSFIATLSAPDKTEEGNIERIAAGSAVPYHSDLADWSSHPTEAQAYVTPDGKHLAFMSVNRLTGYDNEDQATHEPDHEVFEYSAETGQLVCASCDPSGAPPVGSAFIGAKLTERVSTPFHQPRTLSEDGSRLFFSSPDPLVAGLAGGSEKVFQYENGAVQLISGVGGAGNDVFLDASASGDDVFFATREQLVSGDEDELLDVYDARVDGGFPTPIATPPCQGGVCQGLPGQAPSFPSPSSAASTGAGNLVPAATPRPTDEQLLRRAVSVCGRLRSRRRRSACIASAERRYGHRHKGARHGAVRRRRSRR